VRSSDPIWYDYTPVRAQPASELSPFYSPVIHYRRLARQDKGRGERSPIRVSRQNNARLRPNCQKPRRGLVGASANRECNTKEDSRRRAAVSSSADRRAFAHCSHEHVAGLQHRINVSNRACYIAQLSYHPNSGSRAVAERELPKLCCDTQSTGEMGHLQTHAVQRTSAPARTIVPYNHHCDRVR
jgi:hypothetical protein